jgi:predicted dehydrogenase
MSESTKRGSSRREFLKNTGRIAAVSALAGVALPHVHAAENSTIQVALIGCGGRGTGAAANALSVQQGPVKLVAMADAFKDRLEGSYNGLKGMGKDKVDVPAERQFVGYDAYKKAMDCLKPGDVAIFATPPGFRWVHFTYAIEKGLHTFMEKPVTVDGPSSRRMLKLGEAAASKNLKVGVGLMSRHLHGMGALAKRIKDDIGEIILMRGYRMHGPIGSMASGPKPANVSDLEYQIRRFHSFLWASGGCYSDFLIHIIDHCCWMKDAWPTKALALGGRHYRGDSIDQNFDTYSVEYTFPDETKFIMEGRCMNNCTDVYKSCAHGTKGSAFISRSGDFSGPATTFKGLNFKNVLWKAPQVSDDPYQNEWNDLIDAIRNDKPYNEVERGVKASLVTSMGRMSAHTGREIEYEAILNSPHEFAPNLDKLTADGPAPVMPNAEGKYPVPQPGVTVDKEY